jgi:ribosomal protein L24
MGKRQAAAKVIVGDRVYVFRGHSKGRYGEVMSREGSQLTLWLEGGNGAEYTFSTTRNVRLAQ